MDSTATDALSTDDLVGLRNKFDRIMDTIDETQDDVQQVLDVMHSTIDKLQNLAADGEGAQSVNQSIDSIQDTAKSSVHAIQSFIDSAQEVALSAFKSLTASQLGKIMALVTAISLGLRLSGISIPFIY